MELIFSVVLIGFMAYLLGRAKSTHPSQPDSSDQIFDKSVEVVGRYNDAPIHKFITLMDGSRFEFESVAVQAASGVYITSEPDKMHVKFGNLLYKRVSI